MTRYLRAANVKNARFDVADIKEMNFDPREQRIFRLVAGDVLVTEGAGSLDAVGAAATWSDQLDGVVCYQNTLIRLRPLRGTEARFLGWWARHAYESRLFASVAGGANIFHLSAERLKGLPIWLPPKRQQLQIADFLDRETGRIDALAEKKRRLIELLKEKRAALISHVVTKGLDPTVPMKDSGIPWLGDIPVTWTALPLRRIATYRNSNVDKKTIDGEVPVLLCNYTDVYYGTYLSKTDGFMEATASASEVRQFKLRQGSVIITKDSESADDIGVPAYVAADLDAVCGYHLTIVDPHEHRMAGDYLYWALESQAARTGFELAAQGVTRFGLTQDGIGGLVVPVPPKPEQSAIASTLRKHQLKTSALTQAILQQLDLLAEYRQALIAAAVTGQIDVDAEAPDPEEALV